MQQKEFWLHTDFLCDKILFRDLHKGVILQNTVPDLVRAAVLMNVVIRAVFRPNRVVRTHQVFRDVDETPAVLCTDILQENICGLDVCIVQPAVVDISHDAWDRDHIDLQSRCLGSDPADQCLEIGHKLLWCTVGQIVHAIADEHL